MSLEELIDQVLSQCSKEIADVQRGKTKALQSIVGKLMALTKGQADPVRSVAIIRQKLGLPEEIKEKKVKPVEAPIDSTRFHVIDNEGVGGTIYGYGELTFSVTDVINDDEKIPAHIKKYIMKQITITDTTEEEMLTRRRQREKS